MRSVVADAFAEQPVVAELVDALRASPDWLDGLSMVADLDGEVVGHILFTRGLLDAPRALVDVLVLSPVAVATAHQGRGIGSGLVRYGLDVVGRRPEPLVFLEGAPSYYGRLGFEPAEPLGFRRPSLRIPEAAFQVVRLPSYDASMTGTLVYSRAFWDLDCVGLRPAGGAQAAAGDTDAGSATTDGTIRPAYGMWRQYNGRLRDVIAGMNDQQLATRPSPDRWPIWATVGHTAAVRVYWLCEVIGESGAEATPFADISLGVGWEDDLDHPRGAGELVQALDSTFAIVERCLDRWTLSMLGDTIERTHAGTLQVHTRGSILQRLFSHDAYHCGELSQTLGIHGLPQVDLWSPASSS